MTTPHTASLYLNIHAAQWRTTPGRASAHELHRSMTGYAPTALRELPALAAELGVGRVFVKDESDRLGLPAFKILGASWAVCRAVAQRIGMPAENITVESLRDGLRAADSPQLTIVTATDGNHGRAVARARVVDQAVERGDLAVALQQTVIHGARIVRSTDDLVPPPRHRPRRRRGERSGARAGELGRCTERRARRRRHVQDVHRDRPARRR